MAKKSTKKKSEIPPTESESLKKMDALGRVESKQELDEAIESDHKLTEDIEKVVKDPIKPGTEKFHSVEEVLVHALGEEEAQSLINDMKELRDLEMKVEPTPRPNLRWRCDCGLINVHNGTQTRLPLGRL